jgi:hypothetical protein
MQVPALNTAFTQIINQSSIENNGLPCTLLNKSLKLEAENSEN